MDPPMTCCPTLACLVRGQTGPGYLGTGIEMDGFGLGSLLA
jgi:hypothetical protein